MTEWYDVGNKPAKPKGGFMWDYMRRRGFPMIWAVIRHPRMYYQIMAANRDFTGTHRWLRCARFVEQADHAWRLKAKGEWM